MISYMLFMIFYVYVSEKFFIMLSNDYGVYVFAVFCLINFLMGFSMF